MPSEFNKQKITFTGETARAQSERAKDLLLTLFGNDIHGSFDAAYLSADRSAVMGVCGLPFKAPAAAAVMNVPVFTNFAYGNDSFLLDYSKSSLLKCDNSTGAVSEADPGNGIIEAAMLAVKRVLDAPGKLGEKGELILDLKAGNTGLHYPVNLLLGDRSGFDHPLLTTPKSVVDAFGRGSFRATGPYQVLATRYTLNPEENGEPANRQFYLTESGKQIFYSADINDNVSEARCVHSQNRTVITYVTEDGLEVERTIVLLPYEEGMPDAVEAQRVKIRNASGADRNLRIVMTGQFGITLPATLAEDIVFANIVTESEVMRLSDGRAAALTTNSKPADLKTKKRFFMMLTHDEEGGAGVMEEFCTSRTDFIGTGSLEHPQNIACLDNIPGRKMASFFACASSFSIGAGKEVTIDSYTGMCDSEFGQTADAYEAVAKLYSRFIDKAALQSVMDARDAEWQKYTEYLIPESADKDRDAYIRYNLPFQVLYQTYVSRAFAWTQKSYRETGFREIQDIFASMHYLNAAGRNDLIKELIGSWIENVYEMGYANHDFYFKGKGPGQCSDDQLWLVQAVHAYVKLTGDTGFLDQRFKVASLPEEPAGERSLRDTIKALLTYSGRISVGRHGMPLLDRADWNDTLRLDKEVYTGPQKEELYKAQLTEKGQEYGVAWENDLCESVMNACLLKIAADMTAEMADMTGDSELGREARGISEDVAESVQKHAWKGDFFARCLINDGREFTYLGAKGDGLSLDPDIDGTYYLNSYSWAILADIATEDQIRKMLEVVNKYLKTPAGLKLCTLVDYGKLGVNTGTAFYFAGDRENCGVFKHAAMMAAVASVKAARRVEDEALAEELRDLACFMLDLTLPYTAMKDPYVLKGNPRFCTQYNNSETGENIGPMLSGTATWLTLLVRELYGADIKGDVISFDPVMMKGEDSMKYTLKTGNAEFEVNIRSENGAVRTGAATVYTCDGAEFDGTLPVPENGKHKIEVIL